MSNIVEVLVVLCVLFSYCMNENETDCNPWDPDCDAKKPIEWDDDPNPLPDREPYTNEISKDCQRGNYFRQGCRICYCFPKAELAFPSTYCVDLISRPACTYWSDKVHCEDPKLLYNYSKSCEGTCKCIHGHDVHDTYTTCRYLPCFDKILAFHKRYTSAEESRTMVGPETETDSTLDGTKYDVIVSASDEDDEDMDGPIYYGALTDPQDGDLYITEDRKKPRHRVKHTTESFPHDVLK